jgi:CRP-like cAMP-binding protein
MVRGSAEIAMRFVKKMAARVAQANAQVEMLLRADLNHRVTNHLRQLAARGGVAEGYTIRLDVSVDEIAEAVSAAPQQVAACLKRLEQARLITTELGGILIAESGKLDEFLEFLDLKERFGG